MSDSQILRDRVSAALWQLGQESLVNICRHMKCSDLDERDPRRHTRRALIKMVENRLDEIEEITEDEGSQYCTELLSDIDKRSKGGPQPQEEEASGEPAPKEEPELPHNPPHRTTDSPLWNRPEPNRTLPEVTLRREFKIMGQIGESGQKEKLSYLSLVRQIEVGLEKGHAETEIVEAVIRAVGPGLPLRDMLEIKRGLTLNTLLTILKGHYRVDSSTELYNQLINISQEPKESALNFIFRAIELKEKLLWKAEKEETDDQYSGATIQRKFLRSIETGLLSDSVKFQILPYLSKMEITDEELIEKVNEASRLESERQEKKKRFTAVRNPKIQEIQSEVQTDSAPAQSPPKTKEPNSTAAVRTVRGKETKQESINTQQIMEELRTEMRQMFLAAMETSHRPLGPRRRERGCQKCREEKVGETCSHCFKCGLEGHFSRGCRGQRSMSGNGQGLLRWDQQ